MCKSRMEGGQRCASHARTALARADKAMTDAMQTHIDAMLHQYTDEEQDTARSAAQAAVAAHDQAEIEFASTPTGRREYEDKVRAFFSNPYRHEPSGRSIVAGWNTIIAKGEALRRENEAVAADLRIARHPLADQIRAEVALAKEQGYAGWAGANQVTRRLGLHTVGDDPYLHNVAAEQFGFGKQVHGKTPAPTTTVTVPPRAVPAPMTTDEFDAQYLPVRGTGENQRRPLTTSDPSDWGPEESQHWWTVEHGRDDNTITYIAGVSGTGRDFLRTTRPWQSGRESVSVTDNRHLDYDPSLYASR